MTEYRSCYHIMQLLPVNQQLTCTLILHQEELATKQTIKIDTYSTGAILQTMNSTNPGEEAVEYRLLPGVNLCATVVGLVLYH